MYWSLRVYFMLENVHYQIWMPMTFGKVQSDVFWISIAFTPNTCISFIRLYYPIVITFPTLTACNMYSISNNAVNILDINSIFIHDQRKNTAKFICSISKYIYIYKSTCMYFLSVIHKVMYLKLIWQIAILYSITP